MPFKVVYQHDKKDCGPSCLSMISKYYGKSYPLQYLRSISHITKEGVSILGISEAANHIGIDSRSTKISLEDLYKNKELLPCILHWRKNHFVVLRSITKNRLTGKLVYNIADPSHGLISLSEKTFKKSWLSLDDEGIALYLYPTDDFYSVTPPKEEQITVKYLVSYLAPYKKRIAIMFMLLLLGSCFTLVFPFLTEYLIDRGVSKKDLNYISTILLAQLFLFIGSLLFGVIRNWLMLYIGTKISITIISDFLKKLLQLPINFFDTKLMGDFNQRIQDNERIEEFLTSQSLLTFFSVISFSIFFAVLLYYDYKILLVYLLLTLISILWSLMWLKRRKMLDYHRFLHKSENQESIYELLNGVAEMKLNQFESYKISEWEKIQNKLFKLNMKILKVDQIQISGFDFFNQLKNIIVTFLAATYVVKDSMTLGMLLSISYIIGQMNSPVNQLVNFFRSLQDAKLSLERLNEVQNHETEEKPEQIKIEFNSEINNEIKKGIVINNVSFQYEGPKSPKVIEKLNLFIPEGKVTAIVGASGSGKTTLMKLLLKFYNPTEGQIKYNGVDINSLSAKSIRENSGVVMQDGFIFSDSIKRNIATGDVNINERKLSNSIYIANISDFINSLPLKLNTKIGASGNGISGGQKQRILIARAVYKNPHYIFFDEATSALDAENEKIIHNNLQDFFSGKTVVIIAHRLSTVKNADNIIVLKKGKIVEQGSHHELVTKKAEYFNLVKNQLELGT